jgi:hypothetical protein
MGSGHCSFNRTVSTLFMIDGAVAFGDGSVERFVRGGGGGGGGGDGDSDVGHFVIEADGRHVAVRGAWGVVTGGPGEARGGGTFGLWRRRVVGPAEAGVVAELVVEGGAGGDEFSGGLVQVVHVLG